MRTLTRILEHFSVDLPLARARRQYGDRCGRSRSPSQSDGGDPAAIPNTRSREATQGKSLKNALGRTALTLSLLTSLTGCPLLLIGAAGGGVLAAADRRTLPTQVEDRRIQSIANARFIRALPDEVHISTTVFNRRVLLTGEVPGETEKQKAESMVREIANVGGIVNELAIRGASSIGARSMDAYLTTRVKAALVAAKHLSANNLKVVTERSIVYLMGLVSIDEGKRAAAVASQVPGVQQVVTVYEYIQQKPAPVSTAPEESIFP